MHTSFPHLAFHRLSNVLISAKSIVIVMGCALLIFVTPITVAQVTYPPSQDFLGYIWNSGSPGVFPTAEAGCLTLDYNSHGTESPWSYVFLKTTTYVSFGRELWDCEFMLIAKSGNVADDRGPFAMKQLRPVYSLVCDVGRIPDRGRCWPIPEKSEGDTCPATSLPINIATGNKFLRRVVYQGVGPFPLNIALEYNSTDPKPVAKRLPGAITMFKGSPYSQRDELNYPLACRLPLDPGPLVPPEYKVRCVAADTREIVPSTSTTAPGSGWIINFQKSVNEQPDGLVALLTRGDGKAFLFAVANGIWKSDADINGRLERIVSTAGHTRGWRYVTENQDVESYDLLGRLATIENRNGLKQIFHRDLDGIVNSMTDPFGRVVGLGYDEKRRLSTVTDPAGNVTTLTYDSANNLSRIVTPDSYEEYRYENASFPNALTGIVDGNGKRTITYEYDINGKAVKEFRPGGADQSILNIAADGSSTTITDALNTSRTLNFSQILGVSRVTGQSQPGGAGCGAAGSNFEYDANGNVKRRVGFNGAVTTYSHESARNLETARTEAYGTAEARTTTTAWHPELRLPLTIAEPKRRTVFSYDTAGNVLTKTVFETADTNGAVGLAAPAVGAGRASITTYNLLGQITSFTGPRAGGIDVTSYAYEGGNLISITNGLNHQTVLSDYDLNGRVGKVRDASGVTTTLTYKASGLISNKTVSAGGISRSTNYTFDGARLMTKVELPGGMAINYTYDDAHRLTGISDSLGNSITYTLDPMGNRLSQKVTDPNGVLATQVTREYDALNRLQKQTGAAQ